MTDITIPITKLRASYVAYQNAKKDTREAIKRKYQALIEEETQAALTAQKAAFVTELRETKEAYGLTVNVIQDNVLRTRNWKVWEDLRDFGGIEPEQILQANAREEAATAKRGYTFENGILAVFRDHEGEETPRFEFDVEAWLAKDKPGIPVALDENAFMEYARGYSDPHAFRRYIIGIQEGL